MGELEARQRLSALRAELRNIDDEIMVNLVKRASVAKKIGSLKRDHRIEIYDPVRESFNQMRNKELTDGHLPDGFVDELSELLAKWSRLIQAQINQS